ncbi:MAG: Crp/Fnr family transcriptional regulator [Rhodoblastus sp.]
MRLRTPRAQASQFRRHRDLELSAGSRFSLCGAGIFGVDRLGSFKPRRSAAAQAADILAAHPLFCGADAATLSRTLRFARLINVAKGETLFRKGDPGGSLMVIVEGAIRITSMSPNGRELLFNLVGGGEMLGEIAVLDGGPRTAEAVAQSDCLLAVIERRDLLALVAASPEAALYLINCLCKRLRFVTDHLEGVMFLDVEARLARALRRMGGDQDKMKLTQRDLGQSIGMSRETVNQVLGDWRCRRIVRIEKGAIEILDREGFDRLCAGARPA